ncbi:MAG: hypothetical protein WCA81_10360 [Rhizomicrobium sp.]
MDNHNRPGLWGTIITAVVNALALVTAPWAILMGGAIAIALAAFQTTRAFLFSPFFAVAAGVWLTLWWTYVAFRVLQAEGKPRIVMPHIDYRYGLVLEGFFPNFAGEDFVDSSQRGALQFSLQTRNFNPGPIKYTLESLEVQIGTRATPKYFRNSVSGYMARGGGKAVRTAGFPPGSLKEFYGKGETKGTADFVITYGPPDGPPERRFKIGFELTLIFPADGIGALGYADNVSYEADEPI